VTPLATYMPVRNGGDVTGFTLTRDGARIVLAVHDETEPQDVPIISAKLKREDALQLAAWLVFYAKQI
jgi:hypothetical protein